MPTATDNGASPTAADNAKEGTDDAANQLAEAKQRESDARKGMDEAKIEAKKLKEENERLKKIALGEKEEKIEEKKPEYLTKDEFNTVVKFELSNQDKIQLNSEGYESYKEKGYSPQDSLRLAHLDKGITSDTMADHLRQSQSSQGSASTDRSDAKVVPPEVREDMKKWGYSEETYLKNKDNVLKRR